MTLLRELERSCVPALLFSAGLADVLEQIMVHLYDARFPAPTMHVASNRMVFEADSTGAADPQDARLVSFSEPLLHMFNKRFDAIRDSPFARTIVDQNRRNVLLLGDGIGDAAMADGQPADCVLRIGFLNERVAESLAQFSEAFDVLVLNDGPMDVAVDVVRSVLAQDHAALPSLSCAMFL